MDFSWHMELIFQNKFMNEKVLDEARNLIAGFLKQRRIELCLTQADVANECGMSREAINRMEQGLFWLGMKQYLKICAALSLDPFNNKISKSK